MIVLDSFRHISLSRTITREPTSRIERVSRVILKQRKVSLREVRHDSFL